MSTSAFRQLRNVVLVDGARLPFNPSQTVYNKLVAYDLARLALTGILTKTGISPQKIDYCLMGTVIQEVRPRARRRPCPSRPARAEFSRASPRAARPRTLRRPCENQRAEVCARVLHPATI